MPAVVENLQALTVSALPLMSITPAEIVDVPPVAGTSDGVAVTTTFPTAAVPIAILTEFAGLLVVVVVPVVVVDVVPAPAPPESAVIVAVPDAFRR